MKYRTKGDVVIALLWTGENHREMHDFLLGNPDEYMKSHGEHFRIDHSAVAGGLVIKTKDGLAVANIGDYVIKEENNQFRPCKPDIFAATYEEVFKEEGSSKTYLTFGDAIRLLKNGEKLTRPGWNGKGMFLYYVPANSYPAQTDVAKKEFGENGLVPYGAYFAFKSAQGTIESGWKPSTMDMLAEDWQVIN